MFEAFKEDRKSISNKIADYLKELIHEGKFKGGEKIPGEREMAQKLNVSRNTVREAYKILAAIGYLNIKHGNGVYVATNEENIQKITSSFFLKKDQVHELFLIRKVLETTAVKLAIQHLNAKSKSELTYLLEVTREALKTRDASPEELSQLDQKFHITITKASGNSILERIMMYLIDLLGETRDETVKIPGRANLSLKEHIRIIEAILKKDSYLAEKYLLEHLDSVENSILLSKTNGGIKDAPL